MNPSSVAVASVTIIVGSTIVRRMHDGTYQGHVGEILVFGFLLLIALLTLAVVLPDVAKILSFLGIIGAFALNGPAVFGFAGNLGRGKGAF